MSKSIDSGSYRIHKQCYDKLDAEKELEKKEKDALNDELKSFTLVKIFTRKVTMAHAKNIIMMAISVIPTDNQSHK